MAEITRNKRIFIVIAIIQVILILFMWGPNYIFHGEWMPNRIQENKINVVNHFLNSADRNTSMIMFNESTLIERLVRQDISAAVTHGYTQFNESTLIERLVRPDISAVVTMVMEIQNTSSSQLINKLNNSGNGSTDIHNYVTGSTDIHNNITGSTNQSRSKAKDAKTRIAQVVTEDSISIPDVHLEHEKYGHMWDFNHSFNDEEAKVKFNSIALGLGITSKNTKWVMNNITMSLVFFKTLLPSFCKTASKGFNYNFFLAYDIDDKFYNNRTSAGIFQTVFRSYVKEHCPAESNYTIHFIQCSHKGTPARAQNDAMMEAYMSNMQYYYRINDDTVMLTPKWTEAFITTLKSFNPPNVGVVGPTHFGGNMKILTYDFVHYTHIHIHGFYYPHVFTGWYADDWITKVYLPDRSKKLSHIHLQHTLQTGTRYHIDETKVRELATLIPQGQSNVNRYISLITANQGIKAQPDNVISMSISGQNPRYTYGAIRNAQLIPLFYPEWTLRIYVVPEKNTTGSYITNVPQSVIQKLRTLGVDVVILNADSFKNSTIPYELYKYLVIDDESVTRFLIRNPDHRISRRDRELVDHWFKIDGDGNHSSIFCAKDRDQAWNKNLVPGLFGVRNNTVIRNILGVNVVSSLLLDNKNVTHSISLNSEDEFLNKFLRPALFRKSEMKCYKSAYSNVTNKDMDISNSIPSVPFPSGLAKGFALGTVFNEFEESMIN